MEDRKRIGIILLIIAILITGCTARQEAAVLEDPAVESIQRPQYQKDQSLYIAMDAELGDSFNPFASTTRGEETILSLIFTSPLKANADGELIPWNGNILSGRNADGSISYIVTIDENQFFTDGTPIDIDDYLYSLYVKADPTYTGPDPIYNEDIRGIRSYYYDDENWEEDLERLDIYLDSNYSQKNISQEDYIDFLLSTDMDGLLHTRTLDEWKTLLIDDGWKTEVEKAETEEELIEAIALYEYAENMDGHDPKSWYRDNLERAYINRNLRRESHVESISGIERLNSHMARITLDSVNPDTVNRLNCYMVPSHCYGEFEKGHLEEVLSRDIPLGSGPYTFYAEYEDRIVLKANNNYREGIPNIGSVVFQVMDEERIMDSLHEGSVDIGLLRGKAEYLKNPSDNIRCTLVPQGGYPSIFLSSRLEREDRISLYDTIRKVVKFLPLSPVDKKVEAPVNPNLPEYPASIVQRRLPEGKTTVAGRIEIPVLIEDSLCCDNMQKFIKDLRTEMNLNGNTLKECYRTREEIEDLMRKGLADACIIMSEGTLTEKMDMYHSNGRCNILDIDDPMLDEILENLLSEPSLDERRKLTGMLSDRIIGEALEVPLYQNRAIIAYNTDNLDMESIPEVSTASWTFLSTIWSLRKR